MIASLACRCVAFQIDLTTMNRDHGVHYILKR